jgi:hypothetical protein
LSLPVAVAAVTMLEAAVARVGLEPQQDYL